MKQTNDWELVFKSISDLVMILDLDHRIIAVNPTVEKATGKNEKELIGQYCYKIFHCSGHPPEGCPHEKLINSNHPETMDMEMEALDGQYMVTVAPVLNEQGKLNRIIHIAKDITERKKNEEELRRKNRALTVLSKCNQALVRAKDELEFIHELCNIFVQYGGFRLAWMGYAIEDAKKTVQPMAHCGFEDNYLQTLDIVWSENEHGHGPTGTAIRTAKPVVCRNIQTDPKFELWRSEAIKRGYASSMALPLNIDNKCIGALNLYAVEPDAFDEDETNLLIDLADDMAYGIATLKAQTVHEERQKALAGSEKKYRMLVETANDAIFLADTDTGIMLDANQAAGNLLGLPVQKIIGMHRSELHPLEEREHYSRIFKQHAKTGKVPSEDIYVKNSNGNLIPVQVSSSTFRLGNKNIIQGFFRDITEIKKAEEKLRQSQKMEAIGTLAGGIAHDFNNILSTIIGYTELVMDLLPQDSDERSMLKEVQNASIRATELVKQILAFSRKNDQEKKPLYIHAIIKEALTLIRAAIPTSIDIRQNIDKNCGPVLCDSTQIHQIVMNLCINAYHSMIKKEGILEVSMGSITVDTAEAQIAGDLPVGKYIRLIISDTGHGMDKKTMDRIFEPYFTTKNKEEGTGLGLSVVFGIVENHQGHIQVYSEPGKGTTFTVFLPEIMTQDKDTETKVQETYPRGTENILLVDDEKSIAEMLQKMLENFGYHVTSLSDSIKALEAFRERPDQFDLVITDQTMPNIHGSELAKRMIEIKPDIPIILCTGFSSLISKEEASALGIRHFLMKPIVMNELAKAIRKVLDD